jgi:hypothetical protein
MVFRRTQLEREVLTPSVQVARQMSTTCCEIHGRPRSDASLTIPRAIFVVEQVVHEQDSSSTLRRMSDTESLASSGKSVRRSRICETASAGVREVRSSRKHREGIGPSRTPLPPRPPSRPGAPRWSEVVDVRGGADPDRAGAARIRAERATNHR